MEPRSRFITLLSTTSIFIQLYLIYQGISNLLFVQSLQDRPEYRMAEQMLPSLTVSPAQTLFEVFLYAIGIAACIAMLKRLNWGRLMFMVVLSVMTLWEIGNSIMAYRSVSEYLQVIGMGSSLPLILFSALAGLGINGAILWKLSTEEIRKEFVRLER